MDLDREIESAPVALPASLTPLVAGRGWWRDTVGEAGAAVYRLHGARDDLYLKHGTGDAAQDVTDEMARLLWLGRHLPVPGVRQFVRSEDTAWLLMTALPGRTAWQCLTDDADRREATVDAITAFLRTLHALPADACPFESGHPLRLAHARARLAAGVVDTADFGDAHDGWTAERLWAEMNGLLPPAFDRVVTHGDFSLDNILIEEGRVTGCIDVGRAGLADRYQDLAILWECLGEFDAALQDRMFARYGIATPDDRRLRFHLCLDEFF